MCLACRAFQSSKGIPSRPGEVPFLAKRRDSAHSSRELDIKALQGLNAVLRPLLHRPHARFIPLYHHMVSSRHVGHPYRGLRFCNYLQLWKVSACFDSSELCFAEPDLGKKPRYHLAFPVTPKFHQIRLETVEDSLRIRFLRPKVPSFEGGKFLYRFQASRLDSFRQSLILNQLQREKRTPLSDKGRI
ncbi:hypothetical protein K466DRAFT_595130 [Polyporus arcularius HHB13444]|uniref:Uncharacterized protein n=1 Tax=Polyporus arcularius HHB13444 TaxID=1314778 RepID=A0A5C3PV44_9APHY|nr:hypothetical protein K466DRAFT_595130 [Polyporus arcularius HHB13444]